MSAATEASTSERAILWFAMLGAPIAWILHLSVSYSLVSLVCYGGLDSPTLGLVVTTVGAALVAFVAGIAGSRVAGRLSQGGDSAALSKNDWRIFAGRFAAFTSIYFLLGIVIGGFSGLPLPPCG